MPKKAKDGVAEEADIRGIQHIRNKQDVDV